jgi:hypothetical protein
VEVPTLVLKRNDTPSSSSSAMLGPLVRQTLFVKRLPRRYIGALVLLAACAIIGQLLIQSILSQQAYDAHIISLAANQETLSQRVSKDALALAFTTDRQARVRYFNQFTTVALQWNRVHLGLQHGDAGMQLPPNSDSQIAQRFKSLEPAYQGILHAALDTLAFAKAYQYDHPTDPLGFSATMLVPDVQLLLSQEEPFAQGMEGIVNRFEEIASQRVTRVRLTELVLCVLTLCALMGEGLFVFAPAVQRLRRNNRDLQYAEQQLTRNAETLQERNEHLQQALQEVWAVRRNKQLPVQVVSPGQYRVLNSIGDHHYVVRTGLAGLTCECYVGQQTRVCSHILSAAALHAALLRSQRRATNVRPIRQRYA